MWIAYLALFNCVLVFSFSATEEILEVTSFWFLLMLPMQYQLYVIVQSWEYSFPEFDIKKNNFFWLFSPIVFATDLTSHEPLQYMLLTDVTANGINQFRLIWIYLERKSEYICKVDLLIFFLKTYLCIHNEMLRGRKSCIHDKHIA